MTVIWFLTEENNSYFITVYKQKIYYQIKSILKMIKKILLGALVIVLAKCWGTPSTTFTGPFASLDSDFDVKKNNGQIANSDAVSIIDANNNLSKTGTGALNGSPIMTNNIAANTLTNIPLGLNFGTIKNKNIK